MVKNSNSFSARLLEAGAPGFGGYAASILLEKVPAIEERFGAGALASWKSHLTQRVLELAAAVECGDPAVFKSQVHWSRLAFSGRGRDEADIGTSLEVLREVLSDRLPNAARDAPLAIIDDALESLTNEVEHGDAADLDPGDRHQKMALRFVERVLAGESRNAIEELMIALDGGMDAVALVTKVLMPAQREIGRLWHIGKASISEEHLVTAATREALAVVAYSSRPAPTTDKTVVAAGVAGNAHDVGLRATAIAFELAGWRAICLGGDVPADELPGTLTEFAADLLVLSTTLTAQLPETRRTVEAVREHAPSGIKILVGGSVFDTSPELWRAVGADGYAKTIDSAVTEGARLVR